MKINLQLSKKESELLCKVMKAYDFTDKFNCEKLSNKYKEGNEAGSFEYSGLKDSGIEIKFETHEKLLAAACNVYLKYSSAVNGILCGVKSVVMSCKSLFKNFEADYKSELNKAFEEIRIEAKMDKEAKKAEERIRKEIREKAEKEIREKAEADFKRKFDRIRRLEKETEDDDDELY